MTYPETERAVLFTLSLLHNGHTEQCTSLTLSGCEIKVCFKGFYTLKGRFRVKIVYISIIIDWIHHNIDLLTLKKC